MKTYKLTIQGKTALIMHSNNIEARDDLDAIRKRIKGKAGDDRCPVETWQSYLYINEATGNICVPTENLLACALRGGMKIRHSGKETLKAYTQFMVFDDLDVDLMINGQPVSAEQIRSLPSDEFKEQSNAVRNLGFRLFVRPVTVGTSSHVRVRPRFDQWSLSTTFAVDEEDAQVLTPTALNDLWNVCGNRIGIGDWRPSSPKRPGQFGRFTATVEAV